MLRDYNPGFRLERRKRLRRASHISWCLLRRCSCRRIPASKSASPPGRSDPAQPMYQFVAVDRFIGRRIQGRPNRSENERRQARSSFCAIDRRGQHGPGWDFRSGEARRAARRARCRRHAPVDDDDACYVHMPIDTHVRDRSSAAFHDRWIRAGHRVRR